MYKKLLYIFFVSYLCATFYDPISHESYSINIDSSDIEWIGTKITGEHNGTIKIKSGIINYDKNNDNISGVVIVDMESIKNIRTHEK